MRLEVSIFATLSACALAGCPGGDDGDPTAGSAPTDPTDPESSTDPTDTEATPESTGAAETSGTDTTGGETMGGETTSGGPQSCAEATTPEECNAIDTDYEDCQWFATTIVADTAACTEQTGAGTCVNLEGLDGCAHPEPEPAACEGSTIRWFYAERGDGSWELFQAEGEVCGNLPTGFSECYDPTYYEEDPELAATCACACSLG